MDELTRLTEVLREINDDIDYAAETAMVDDGLLDSFDLTRMIAALDEEYGIHIDTGEIEPENFNSAAAILDLVRSCQNK